MNEANIKDVSGYQLLLEKAGIAFDLKKLGEVTELEVVNAVATLLGLE